jgi:hypothetical protein
MSISILELNLFWIHIENEDLMVKKKGYIQLDQVRNNYLISKRVKITFTVEQSFMQIKRRALIF